MGADSILNNKMEPILEMGSILNSSPYQHHPIPYRPAGNRVAVAECRFVVQRRMVLLTKSELFATLIVKVYRNNMTHWQSHISSNPNVLFGKPVIVNTRIPVDLILEKLANGDTVKDLLAAYPNITREDINACLLFAAESVKNEIVHPNAS